MQPFTESPALFTPLQVGRLTLSHRIVLAPLTRSRATKDHLPDQFLQDVSNQRTDKYGGSVENRARFPIEIIEAIAKAVGEERVGFRISPWNPWQGMRMEDPKPTFAYFVSQVKERFPNLAYLHAVEPGIAGNEDYDCDDSDSNEFLRKIWGDKVFIATGGYSPETAAETVSTQGGLIAFGRNYLANVSFLPPIHQRQTQSRPRLDSSPTCRCASSTVSR